MVCKECGGILEKKERFCPHCGSYFIDRDCNETATQWRGVIQKNGSLNVKAATKSVETDRKSFVWGIIAAVGVLLLLIFNILGLLYYEMFSTAGMFIFLFDLVAYKKAKGFKYRKWILLILLVAVFLFIKEVLND